MGHGVSASVFSSLQVVRGLTGPSAGRGSGGAQLGGWAACAAKGSGPRQRMGPADLPAAPDDLKVLVVGADPEREDAVVHEHTDSSMVPRGADAVDRLGGMHALEAKPGMVEVLLEVAVGLTRALSDVGRKSGVRAPERLGRLSNSQLVRVEPARLPVAMLPEGLAREAGQLVERRTECLVPARIRFDLTQKPPRDPILFRIGEFRGLGDRLLEKLRHRLMITRASAKPFFGGAMEVALHSDH